MTTNDYGKLNMEMMMEFNRRFIDGEDDGAIPPDAVVVFLPGDPDHRNYNINLGLKLIDQGNDVFFKRLDFAEREVTVRCE